LIVFLYNGCGVGYAIRMKYKGDFLPLEEAIPLEHVFGINWWVYWLPIDPIFLDADEVLRYKVSSLKTRTAHERV
jgi:hypothetical protein